MSGGFEYDPDYATARTKALFNSVLARLAGDRIAFCRSIRSKTSCTYAGRLLWHPDSAVKNIIGSVDRYRDSIVCSCPHNLLLASVEAINRAFYRDEALPPVKLYQVGEPILCWMDTTGCRSRVSTALSLLTLK